MKKRKEKQAGLPEKKLYNRQKKISSQKKNQNLYLFFFVNRKNWSRCASHISQLPLFSMSSLILSPPLLLLLHTMNMMK